MHRASAHPLHEGITAFLHPGVSYHRLYNWVRRFDLAVDPWGERNIYLPESTVVELHRLARLEDRLQDEGVTYAEAARLLGVQSRTIDARVCLGVLDALDEVGPDGARYVTRASVQRAQEKPELMTIRRARRRGC